MRNRIINRIWLILLLFVLLTGFGFGCGKEVGVGQNQPPTVSILSPQDGNRYDPATIIGFAGEAADLEQGTLSGGSLVWRSDIDGIIGVGKVIASQLSLGPHTITLTATDNNRAQGTVSITLEIRDDLWKQFNYANHIGDSAIEETSDGDYLWAATKGGVVRWSWQRRSWSGLLTPRLILILKWLLKTGMSRKGRE
jgi:hypothetical protein